MGRYVGNVWHEELADPGGGGVQGNNIPVGAPPSGGGGGGGGGQTTPPSGSGGTSVSSLVAADGQTLGGQSPETQAQFRAAYGSNAEQIWVSQHNQAIGASGSTPPTGNGTTPPPSPAVPPDTPDAANLNAAQILFNQAQQAAYQAYLNARLNLETDQQAFNHAQQAWQNTFNAGQLTGTYNGAPTLAAQAQQQKTTLDYLNLLSSQRGPQDYSQYLRTLGSTPGGLRDLVGAAAGQYVPASGATTGVAPTAASLSGLVNAATTGASGGTTYASYQAATAGLPAPNQIAPAAFQSFTDSQKKMLFDAYQSQGWNPQDVQSLYNQSLPKYGGAPQAGTVKL